MIACCLALLVATSSAALSPRELRAVEDGLVLEGDLEACEIRERGLLERLQIRSRPPPAIPAVPVPAQAAEIDVGLLVGVAGGALAAGVLLGILAAGALQ